MPKDNFWSGLSSDERSDFIRDADWEEIQQIPEAKKAKLEALVSLQDICDRLVMTASHVYLLMSTRKMSGTYLVDGTWRYDPNKVDQWLAAHGGLERVKQDVEQQVGRHRTLIEK